MSPIAMYSSARSPRSHAKYSSHHRDSPPSIASTSCRFTRSPDPVTALPGKAASSGSKGRRGSLRFRSPRWIRRWPVPFRSRRRCTSSATAASSVARSRWKKLYGDEGMDLNESILSIVHIVPQERYTHRHTGVNSTKTHRATAASESLSLVVRQSATTTSCSAASPSRPAAGGFAAAVPPPPLLVLLLPLLVAAASVVPIAAGSAMSVLLLLPLLLVLPPPVDVVDAMSWEITRTASKVECCVDLDAWTKCVSRRLPSFRV